MNLMTLKPILGCIAALLTLLSSATLFADEPGIFDAQGEMAGEIDEDSAILQSRSRLRLSI